MVGDTVVGAATGTAAELIITAALTTVTAHGMADTTAPVGPTMEQTAARTIAMATTPPPAPMPAARQLQRPTALKRWDRPTTHTPGPLPPLIRGPTPTQTGEARRP